MRKQKSTPTEPFIEFANGNYLHGRIVDPNESFSERLLRDKSKAHEVQSKLRKLLRQIVKKQKIVDSKELRYFTKILEQAVIEYKVQNGKLVKRWHTTGIGAAYFIYPTWLRDLADNLIPYLSDSKNNIRKIKRCSVCSDYFIATNTRREVCPYPLKNCEKIRKREWQRNWMQERRNPADPKFDPKYIR